MSDLENNKLSYLGLIKEQPLNVKVETGNNELDEVTNAKVTWKGMDCVYEHNEPELKELNRMVKKEYPFLNSSNDYTMGYEELAIRRYFFFRSIREHCIQHEINLLFLEVVLHDSPYLLDEFDEED